MIANKNLAPEEMHYEDCSFMHPKGGKFLVFATNSRAGNKASWALYMELVREWMDEKRQLLHRMGEIETWSRQGWVSSDGEYQQMMVMVVQEFIDKCIKENTHFVKLPSACSRATQASDMATTHKQGHPHKQGPPRGGLL